jgi:hypothetical protein
MLSHPQDIIANLKKCGQAIGVSSLVVLAVGTVVGVSCTVWAVAEGVPWALAMMAGYCCLSGSACLSVILCRRKDPAREPEPTGDERKPNYAAWRLVCTLRVSDAARLWSGIEPGCPVSQEAIAWAQAILDAIKRGELPIHDRKDSVGRSVDQERANPGWHTEITREALRTWAQSHGHAPPFLLN